jgi:Rps23 Pro-64 3,4-dihydroxylase Tpa1-like proline 4-hydroxylase
MVLDKEKLLNDGYLIFNIKDLDESLYNDLYNNFNKGDKFSSINILRYDSMVECDLSLFSPDEYFINLKDKFKLNQDSEIEHYIVDENKIKFTLKLKGEYQYLSECKTEIDNLKVNIKAQSWLYNSIHRDYKISNIIESIYKKILSGVYEDYIGENLYSENKINMFDLTLYEKNDFIEPHSDGVDPQRLCVILIYLNDDYQEGFGGELVIENKIIVPPLFGNVAILDFTTNNPIHSVNHVLDDNFKRFAFIKFFYKEKLK